MRVIGKIRSMRTVRYGLNPIDQTISLMTVRRTVGQDGAITVEDLIPDGTIRVNAGGIEQRIQLTQFAVENLVDKDDRYSALIVQTEPMEDAVNTQFYLALDGRRCRAQARLTLTLELGGLPSLVAQLDLDTQKNVGAITMASLLVMAMVLINLFRFWSGIVGPLLVVINWFGLGVRFYGMDRDYDELCECDYPGIFGHCRSGRFNSFTVELRVEVVNRDPQSKRLAYALRKRLYQLHFYVSHHHCRLDVLSNCVGRGGS